MPHQCVRCSAIFDDGAKEILQGCKCGARLFYFFRKEHLQQTKEITTQLTKQEKVQMEEQVKEIVGTDEDLERPIILDLESIRVKKPGKFDLDLVHLFNKKNPLVYKLDEGKYVIDLAETFRRQAQTSEVQESGE